MVGVAGLASGVHRERADEVPQVHDLAVGGDDCHAVGAVGVVASVVDGGDTAGFL